MFKFFIQMIYRNSLKGVSNMEPTVYSGGRMRKGWDILKGSWHVLTLDKELMALPILSILASLFAVSLVLALGTGALFATGQVEEGSSNSFSGPVQLLFGLAIYFALTLV